MIDNDFDAQLEDLLKVHRILPRLLLTLSYEESEFLLSVEMRDPNWAKHGLNDDSHLPGIELKLLNIGKLDLKNRKIVCEKLEALGQ